MPRSYLKALVAFAIITALLAIKDIGLLVLMLTLGLAFPLLFSATALLYLLCAYPAVTLWRNGGSERLLGLGLSAIAMLAATTLPGLYAKWNVATGATQLRAGDIKPTTAIVATGLEIRRPNGSDWSEDANREPCGGVCRALLLGGRVDWVRVVQLRPHDRKNPETRTFHKAEIGAACSVPGSPKAAADKCVIMAGDHGGPADLVLRFEQLRSKVPVTGNFDLVRWHGTRRVTAHHRQGGDWHEVLRQTAVDADVVGMPTAIVVKITGMSSKGLEFVRSRHRANQSKLADALSMLGLDTRAGAALALASAKPRDWKESINDTMTRELIAVLDLPQSDPFSSEQTRVVSDWVMHARQVKAWSPALIAVLQRIARDRRIRHVSFFDQVFERNRPVTEALLPEVLERLESEGVTSDDTPARQAAYTFTRLDPVLLAPHQGRIVTLIDKRADLAGLLRPAVGRLGVDPLPLLLPIGADLAPPARANSSHRFARLKGACFAERRWAPRLIPELRAALTMPMQGADTWAAREFQPAVLRSLANLGDTAFVDQELAKREGKDAERLTRQIRFDLGQRRGSNGLCNF